MICERRSIMGMPVTVMLASAGTVDDAEAVFALLREVDEQFSTYKPTSEISRLNAGLIQEADYSPLMRVVLEQCEAARVMSGGYFNIWNGTILDPSGLVKGWAIDRACQLLLGRGRRNFFIDCGGDVIAMGHKHHEPWRIGIRHPVRLEHIVKRLAVTDMAVCTSGAYERGNHIYDPLTHSVPRGLLSFTVVGPNVMVADVLATTGFAMGAELGLRYVSSQPGYSAFAITDDLQGLSTAGFAHYAA